MRQQIYLDNSTACQPSEMAISRMMPYYTDRWGISTAPHQKGQELFPFLADFYRHLYDFVGAGDEDSFHFTSSGAEAVNHVIHSVYRDVTLPTGKNQFLTSGLDEAPAILAAERLDPLGCVSKTIGVDACGRVTAETLTAALSPRTALVSLSWANGLTGVIQPIAEIAELCRLRGVRLHLDATHVLGKLIHDWHETGADYLTFNGEQLHAPRGTGGLFVKQGVKISPFILGNPGVPTALLAGLAQAATEAKQSCDYLGTEIARLRSRLEKGIVTEVPGTSICFREAERLPHCTTLLFPGITNEALLFALNRKGLCATIGGGTFQQLGLMLAACGLEENLAHSAISFSLSRYTHEAEIDRAIELIAECAKPLQNMSKKILEPES